MKQQTYRDGGTRSFTDLPFNKYFDKNVEICQDNRIGSNTNEWYLGHPDKGRLLTDEEKGVIVPIIIKKLGEDYRWSKYFYENMRDKNKDYLFEDNFSQVFSMRSGHQQTVYKSDDDFEITAKNNRCLLKNEKGEQVGSGTLQECFVQYNILKGNI